VVQTKRQNRQVKTKSTQTVPVQTSTNLPVTLFLRAKAAMLSARLSYRNSVRPSVRPSVCHMGGSGKNDPS